MGDLPKRMKPKKIEDDRSRKYSVLIASGIICVALIVGIVIASASGSGKKGKGALKAQTETRLQTSGGLTETGSTAQTVSPLEQVLVPPLSIYRRRNPFKPLVNMEQPQTPQETGTGQAGSGYVTVPPEISNQTNQPGEVLSRAITLDAVYEEEGRLYARIRVADQVYDRVGVGDRFGDYFKVLTLGSDGSATLLYGDERMTLYTGQTVNW